MLVFLAGFWAGASFIGAGMQMAEPDGGFGFPLSQPASIMGRAAIVCPPCDCPAVGSGISNLEKESEEGSSAERASAEKASATESAAAGNDRLFGAA